MDINVKEQKVFVVEEHLTAEQARERAWEHKTDAFGTLTRLFMRPKSDEIKVASIQKRFDPVWHFLVHKRVAFQRRKEYRVPVTDNTVQRVTAAGNEYAVSGGHFNIAGIEHCEEDVRLENLLDGTTGELKEDEALMRASRQELVEVNSFAPTDAVVVQPELKASGALQRIVQHLTKRYEADEVLEEFINVEHLYLLYHPVYAFEYVWEKKGKRVLVELDAATGNTRTVEGGLQQKLQRFLGPEVLFDLGREAAKLVVPGGEITLKILGKVITGQREKGS